MSDRSPLHSPPDWRSYARMAAGVLSLAVFAACATDSPGPTELRSHTTSESRGVSGLPLASPAWQRLADTLVSHAALSPIAAGHAYPILSVAQYLAVQKAEAAVGGDNDAIQTVPGSGIGAGGRTRLEADRGAVAGASAVVLNYLFPTQSQAISDLVDAQRNAGPGAPFWSFAVGEAIGRTVGSQIVDRARIDKFDGPNVAVPLVGPGYWVSSAIPAQPVAGGNLMAVTRWFLLSTDQFRPGDPPAYGSAAFNTALAEIRKMSDTSNASMQSIAGRWALNNGTPTASGFWLGVASDNIESHGLSEREATHVYALASATMFDAIIGCWDAKLTYWLIRPWKADAGINVLASVGKPNHPSYPSGHSCVSSSGAEVLANFFPDKRSELVAMVTEAGLSRMYGGIHYRFDIEAGQTLGRNVAHYTIAADVAGTSILTAH